MPRRRRDGAPAAVPNKRKLSDIFLKKLKPQVRAFRVWDNHQPGLVVVVQPTGHKAWKCVYPFHGRPRWYHIGSVDAFGLAAARKLASRVLFQVAEGNDPASEKKAERSKGTFEELATRYVEDYAKRNNKSWKQADALVRRHLVPRWGKLQAADVSRSDVKAMMAHINAPIVANQVLAAASAIFAWAIREEVGQIKVNPCQHVGRNKTKKRERVLSDSEIPRFWTAFDTAGSIKSTALKIILLTGQRPGEVAHMHREHIKDGWWEMPGDPEAARKWPGTKNAEDHRVWLPAPAQALLAEMDGKGLVFAGLRGKAVKGLDGAMRSICARLNDEAKELDASRVDRATPHDLRRTFSTKVTGLGFGTEAMNRVTNHKEGGISSVYDRHGYGNENKNIMETVAARIMLLVEGGDDTGVVLPFAIGRRQG